MALTLENASYVYSAGTALAQPALSGVSLTLERGDLACVLGPSGSGKTTLLRLASGLLPPTEGAVHADGGPVGIVSASGGRTECVVGIAFQRPENQLFAETVAEDVAFGPRNLGLSREEAREAAVAALEAVALSAEAFADRSPFTLSGGEARRVALAGVLAMSPRYLLLDEPTAGLDAPGREAVVRAVARARERAGVLVVTHDPEEFLADADRAVVLREGSPVFAGDVDDLLDRAWELSGDGLWAPPEILRTQLLAVREGHAVGALTLDPRVLAARLAGERS